MHHCAPLVRSLPPMPLKNFVCRRSLFQHPFQVRHLGKWNLPKLRERMLHHRRWISRRTFGYLFDIFLELTLNSFFFFLDVPPSRSRSCACAVPAKQTRDESVSINNVLFIICFPCDGSSTGENEGILYNNNTTIGLWKFILEATYDTGLYRLSCSTHCRAIDACFGNRTIFGDYKLNLDLTTKAWVFRKLTLVAIANL